MPGSPQKAGELLLAYHKKADTRGEALGDGSCDMDMELYEAGTNGRRRERCS